MATKTAFWGLMSILTLSLSGCGGGGGDNGGSQFGISTSTSYVAGIYMPSAQFANQCKSPRTGVDPYTHTAYPDRPGSLLMEQLWLRSWSNELYLWYNEITDTNPANYSTAIDYFNVLRTTAVTPSGNPKDKFHFTYDTSVWESFAQSGVQAGYGAEWVSVGTTTRKIMVGFVEPGSPAALAIIQRGAEVKTVDGADVATGNVSTLRAGLYPSIAGETHILSILDPGASAPRTVTLISANVTSTPVQNVTAIPVGGLNVGYLLFNDHIATAESQLINAVNQLKALNVVDLVVDLRYNGGGYLDIASEFAYMIAGPTRTAGQTFERIQFNDKNPNIDPVTKQALTPTPFLSTAQGFSAASGTPLPTLNLPNPRVFVLTGPGTCSASESIINSLRGIGIQVIQIGSTTCGKPYGFYPQDNCGTTYFTIEFKGVNAVGFGDYTDGFSPNNTVANAGTLLPGCSVADDLTHQLGDPLEGRLAAALAYRASGACPVASGFSPNEVQTDTQRQLAQQYLLENADDVVSKPPIRENRWY